MAKFRFRYAMCVYIDAETEEEAQEVFEDMDLSNAQFVELEDVSLA